MKPKASLRLFLALAGSSIFAISSASADTFTWTLRATGSQDWETAGNWASSTVFVSGTGNELSFSTDAKTPTNITGTQTITNVPSTLSMNTLTLGGVGPNNTTGLAVIIGDNTSTWTIGDSTTSTVNLSNITGSGSGIGDRDLRYTIAANLSLVGDTNDITTFTGNSNSITGANFSGNITEATAGQGITKSGTSLLIFSGNNSYTGATSVTGGTLRLSHANALSGGIGTTGGTSALTVNASVIELGATDFSRGLGTGSSQFQITGGVSGFGAFGGPRKVTVNGDASQELQWGSTHFAPTTLVLNTVHSNNSIELANKLDLNGATRTVQVDADRALISGDIRTASGTAGLTKTGVGTLILTGNNTYNGDTTISAGTLSVGSASNIGGSGTSNLIMSGGSLQIRGTTLTSLSDLDSTVTFSNTAKGFDIHNAANTFTVDQVLSGTGASSTLTKSGIGTLVLNQNNTFAGATTVSGGGTLVLDYSSNNGSKLSDTAALTLTGTTIELSGGSHGEVVLSTAISNFTANSITRSSGTAVLNLNAISGGNRSALSFSAGSIATTDTVNNATGILGGWVTVGSHLAINSTNGADGAITAYNGYTNFVSSSSSSTTNYQLLGSGSVTAAQAMNTLRIENTADDQVLDLQANKLTIANFNAGGVLLYAGGANNNYTITGTTGSLSPANGSGQSFGINVYQGNLTLDVGLGFTTSQFIKTGAGTLIMNKNGTTTGDNYLLQGVTRMAHALALGTTGSVTVNAGAALELSNGITVGAKTLSLNGGGISNGGSLRNHSGSNSYAGAISIGSSGARINSDASSSLSLTGGVVTALTQDVTFGGAGDTTVSTTGISGGGSVVKDGAGTLTLSAANTYTGATTVSAGTLYVTGSLSSSEVSVSADGTLGGNGTLGNGLTIAAGGNLDLTGATLGLNSNDILGLTGGTLTLGNLTFQDIVGWDWADATAGTYELIDGSFTIDWGSTAYLSEGTAYDFGNGMGGYFTEGSLNAVIVVIPEPNAAMLIGLAGFCLLVRRRRC